MFFLALSDASLAIVMALWLRAVLRARGGEIPCTERMFSWGMVAIAVVAMVGLVVVNVVVLKALDDAFGKTLSPILFTGWLLAISGAAILFIFAITALHTNRTATAWIRVVPPAGLRVRVAGEASTLELEPGAVRILGVADGPGGLMYVQYLIHDERSSIALVVPFTRDARPATNGAPRLNDLSGLVVQGDARKLHRYLTQFCEPDRRSPASA